MIYKRYKIEEVKDAFENFAKRLETATCVDDLINARLTLQQVTDAFSTAQSICYYNYCLDTSNEFYKKELTYYDENYSVFFDIKQHAVKLFCSNKYGRQALEHIHPEIARTYNSAFDINYSKIEDELNQESILINSYIELMSSLQYTLDGTRVSFQELQRILRNSKDEYKRKRAAESIGQALASKKQEISTIISKLVIVRNSMAIKSGFSNFVDFSYARLGRIDYTPTDVSRFKLNILKYITPLLKRIKTNDNHQNLVKYYNDEWYNLPCYAQITTDNIINIIEKILERISNDVAVDFQTMYQSGLIDVEQRAAKVNYNFCTSFQGKRKSAILINLTGSIKDIDTLMHEFGHALANKYMFDREDSEIGLGGRETMEAHALMMELFGAFLMDEFFDDETNSLKRKYIINALNTMAYSAVVDDFQEKIYNHPNASVDEWNAFYLESEKKYRPYLDYSNITYLEEGTKWQLQSHIFEIPFYYIEYGLAQVMALSFWSQIKNDYKKAYQKFSEFLKQSGTLPLDKLIESNNLFSPFETKSFQKTISFFNSQL